MPTQHVPLNPAIGGAHLLLPSSRTSIRAQRIYISALDYFCLSLMCIREHSLAFRLRLLTCHLHTRRPLSGSVSSLAKHHRGFSN